MSSAMTQIVEAYVKLKDRTALEQLQAHRRKMIETLQTISAPFDPASPMKQSQEELAIIEKGITRLSAG